MKHLIFAILLVANCASAGVLNDVQILKVTPGNGTLELTLQLKDGPEDSYFLVDMMKDDPDIFEKMSEVIKKLANKDSYILNLNIISFSASPSGSYYRSYSVAFSGKSAKK